MNWSMSKFHPLTILVAGWPSKLRKFPCQASSSVMPKRRKSFTGKKWMLLDAGELPMNYQWYPMITQRQQLALTRLLTLRHSYYLTLSRSSSWSASRIQNSRKISRFFVLLTGRSNGTRRHRQDIYQFKLDWNGQWKHMSKEKHQMARQPPIKTWWLNPYCTKRCKARCVVSSSGT